MPFLRCRFPFIFRLAAFLALLAVFTPAATSLLHHPTALPSFVHICGSLPANGNHDKAPAHQLPPCPICQSQQLLGGGPVPPTALTLPAPILRPLIYRPYFQAAFAYPHDTPQAQPRAPPVLV